MLSSPYDKMVADSRSKCSYHLRCSRSVGVLSGRKQKLRFGEIESEEAVVGISAEVRYILGKDHHHFLTRSYNSLSTCCRGSVPASVGCRSRKRYHGSNHRRPFCFPQAVLGTRICFCLQCRVDVYGELRRRVRDRQDRDRCKETIIHARSFTIAIYSETPT